jgi:hypothetical protein
MNGGWEVDMLWILIIGISMAIISGGFWVLEFNEGFQALRSIPMPQRTFNPFKAVSQSVMYLLSTIAALFKFWKLVLDVGATIWLAGSFGFSGMIGGVIGLTVSNVISIYLISIQPKGGGQRVAFS